MDCRIYGFGKLNQCCYNSGSVSHKHEWYGSIVLCIHIESGGNESKENQNPGYWLVSKERVNTIKHVGLWQGLHVYVHAQNEICS